MNTEPGLARVSVCLHDFRPGPVIVAVITLHMQRELRDIISNFRHDQERALDYLHSRLGLPVPTSNVEWATQARAQIESVTDIVTQDGVRLRKHGYGIEVIHPDFQIDFDYGPAGECDCFDAWRLGLHKHVSLKLPEPVECQQEIRDWIAVAHENGDLVRVTGRNSFYIWPESRSKW